VHFSLGWVSTRPALKVESDLLRVLRLLGLIVVNQRFVQIQNKCVGLCRLRQVRRFHILFDLGEGFLRPGNVVAVDNFAALGAVLLSNPRKIVGSA